MSDLILKIVPKAYVDDKYNSINRALEELKSELRGIDKDKLSSEGFISEVIRALSSKITNKEGSLNLRYGELLARLNISAQEYEQAKCGVQLVLATEENRELRRLLSEKALNEIDEKMKVLKDKLYYAGEGHKC